MLTLRVQYLSILLDRRIPTHPVPILSDHWLNGYPYLCTLVLPVSTCKLFPTECYRHAAASRPIPFDSSRRADSNETLPESGGHLPAEGSPFSSLVTSIAMPCGLFKTYTIRFHSTCGFQHTLYQRCPTTGGRVIHSFVLEFPGYVSSNCWLPSASGMGTLRDLYHSIPHGERTPMGPSLTLADICPLRYQPFSSC